MKLLLDTQAFLWMQVSPERLGPKAIRLVQDPANELLLSSASSWEIAIKYAIDKLPLPEPPSKYVPDRMASSGVTALPIAHSHALHVADLPQHHRDPFDRLIIAQARMDRLTVLTADRTFDKYDVKVRWAA
ncbi:PIN domain nuclease of toxin-antitoxin system [Herbihabitans rhizosphaerae]|uniref:PIN domain nuclease of toxin-antitoxin system n=1 Tax=Herbihabitans rhizosphaerae TaxID=1872711 RepID=A0A4V2ESD0_9PSEU|nr:type II toxin-antitoxin system VapC family toxin [Herbihabitans rhizosphaerae]RZS37143.1 PIN domain nuclease of toxin-antitoxin system [Herbihabitans rhizosphaerae]